MRSVPLLLLPLLFAAPLSAADTLVLKGKDGPGRGRHIVIVSGDEEYRGEESAPMLAKILSQRHGFDCTVVFAWTDDHIDPNNQAGLRGLECLDSADLMIIGTRFRRPSDEHAAVITRFLDAGKPVIGFRTATHAFTGDGKFGEGDGAIPYGAFGRKVLGEQWVNHHGGHGYEGTRGVIEPGREQHPILRGVEDVFGPTDVYGVIHLTDADTILLRGAVTKTLDPDSPPVTGERNNPMMPLAWLHEYTAPNGTSVGRSFCTTLGASVDFASEDLRRLMVNAAFHLLGVEVPAEADVTPVDPFYPSFYGFIRDGSWFKDLDLQVEDLEIGRVVQPRDPPGAPAWLSRPRPIPSKDAKSGRLPLVPGDRLVLLGNSLAERMQHHGWLETELQLALPELELVVRNHGFGGDTVTHRPRSRGFIDPHTYLEISGASVILAFFGQNESWQEDPERYRTELSRWVDETRSRSYDGRGTPRIVLFSPIAHENLGTPELPDGIARNRVLAEYAAVTREVADQKGLPFVDLYAATSALYSAADTPLTINGIHLTEEGNRVVARYILSSLLGISRPADPALASRVRAAVLDKNWHWFNRYRATDGNDVWGGRADLKFVDDQSNRDVLWHELTMIDVMTANRDRRIWALAAGLDDPGVDDSNVPPPVSVKTNVGGGSSSSDANKEGQGTYLPAEETAAQLELAEGLEVNVFASEAMFPEVVNPVQLAVDPRGRLWVASWPTYPKWEPLKPMNDRIVILPDEDRDGVADRAITFAKVRNPTGFEFWGNGVIVASAPDLIYLEDTDGDDVADVRVRILHGLDSADTHHAANGLIYGPDGHIYYQRGVFHVSNVETPWGPPQEDTRSGMYRFNPRTYEFSFHAVNSPNPHGTTFTYWGEHLATDGTGGECFQVRPHESGAFRMRKILRKTVRPVAASGILSSEHFPAEFQDDFLVLNTIGFLGIKRYGITVDENGDVTGTEEADLLRSPRDRNFRPTDLEIGGDGALYVSDWQNIIIGHMQHNVRDPSRDHEYGRIYRITAKDRPLMEPVAVAGEPVPVLLDRLTHPTNIIRYRTRIELSGRPTTEVIAALATWLGRWDFDDPAHAHHLLEGLWLHQQHDVPNPELLAALLRSPEPRARNAARTVRHFWEMDADVAAAVAALEEETVQAPLTPTEELIARGLDEEARALYQLGSEIFVREAHCATCHQLDGQGLPGQYPPITPNPWVAGDEERLIKLTLMGIWGNLELDGKWYRAETDQMPPMTQFKEVLDDREIAAVLTYVRNTFGNDARPVSPETVARVRAGLEERYMWYMVEEILKEHPIVEDEIERFRNPR
ncbi:MAG: PVC-type heme-binding CxxCH protein [Planctomycetota bacterium]